MYADTGEMIERFGFVWICFFTPDVNCNLEIE